jgi:hypothetical protein
MFRKYCNILSLITLLFFVLLSIVSLAQDLPKGELPIMITSSGQSPDAFVVKVLLDRAKISATYNNLLEAEELKGYKTLLIVMGGSTKGLGAAGIDEKFELDRTRKILDEAEKQGITMLGIHIGGEGRRGPLSMQFIEVVAPRMQALIVTEEGNKDGYFTKLSEEKNIPLVIVKTTPEVGEVLQKIFQQESS